MIGIYKIENKINGKIYIGQSIHIERRWQEHCRPSTSSMIANAIKEYGKENFTFEVLEECSAEELNTKEEEYIHKFDCLVPKGYNVSENKNGQLTTYVYYSPEVLQNIIKDLEECKLTMEQIAKKYWDRLNKRFLVQHVTKFSLPFLRNIINYIDKKDKKLK